MKPSPFRMTCAALAASLGLGGSAIAEDIDLFTSPSSGAIAPNILIILDNSSNWSRNDQAWPIGKQGESELRAIYTLLGDSSIGTNVNLGLMMFTSGAPDGAYVRYAVRNMTDPNKARFRELIGTSACIDGINPLTNSPNCILKNFDSPTEKINASSTLYSSALFEAFKYFGGYTEPAKANLDQPGSPVDRQRFGPARHAVVDKADRDAFTDGARTIYRGPINADGSNSCAKNYIIFIGNGYPSNDTITTILAGINGNNTVPAPIGNKSIRAANWAKYLFTTDVNEVLGKQNIVTYTIDVFNARPDPSNQTPLLKGMAKFGGGRYFEARDEDSIVRALREVVIEIQAVNSVFASASLPINATNRSQNENQVFIGMFRPDSDAKPVWYGNLKQFQIALFGDDAKLADKDGQQAVAATTGFIQACSTSFWTTPTGTYWDFSSASQGTCTSVANSAMSDLPDGGVVEKGGAAEVLRKGNDPSATAPFTVNRSLYTCAGACGAMVTFNDTNVPMGRTGASTAAINTEIINFSKGQDVKNENAASTDASGLLTSDPRPTIHGDIAHSRPLPVNFGGTRKVVVYYGSNDGMFKAVEGATGKELWAFVAPEHHSKLKRLYDNDPIINYPNLAAVVGSRSKDYFFDGSSGLYQNADNSKVWIFPTMRRGGRMIYAFDVTNTIPVLKWAVGCPNAAPDDTGCTAGAAAMGQTWSGANVAFVRGFSATDPIVIMGGGYDSCLDADVAASTCTAASKGNAVFMINANTGAIVKTFATERSVASDVTLVDRDFDGSVDHAYVADALGAMYRIDFVNTVTNAPLAPGAWSITKIAFANTGNRKFLFGPAALALGGKVYLAVGSGDRERPLKTNYPYMTPISNRFYTFIDSFTNVAYDLNGASMTNYTSATSCSSALASGQNGWYMDLEGGRGEQTVTSAVIFGGTVFFSTNRPVDIATGSCGTNLGEARGYAVNLLNASGVIGTGSLCGGSRSGVFTGGGIPPSPVVGVVPVRQPDGSVKPTNVLIGGINLETGTGSPIGAQEPKVPIKQIRSRVYWYPQGER